MTIPNEVKSTVQNKVKRTIEQKLAEAFSNEHLLVENESHKHSVPPNSETHFKVTLVSSDFEGQSKVKRHQTLYQVLSAELAGGVHALALHLYSKAEWESQGQAAPESPNCLGGSKNDPAFASGSQQ